MVFKNLAWNFKKIYLVQFLLNAWLDTLVPASSTDIQLESCVLTAFLNVFVEENNLFWIIWKLKNRSNEIVLETVADTL